MSGEKFLTLHPDPSKQGVNIDGARYEQVKAALLEAIREHGEITFQRLTELMEASLAGRFDGSIGWYTTVVKLDLEARGLIAVERGSPQTIRLPEKS